MWQHEKDGLLGLLGDRARWCRDAEARDVHGEAVHFDDPSAVAWDLTGALCRLFGWGRAQELFPHLERHLTGSNRSHVHPRLQLVSEPQIIAMAAVQDYNDFTEHTYEMMMQRLQTLVVYRPEARRHAAGCTSI